jgi:hypothetical protein
MGVLGEAAVTHVLKSDGQSIPLAAFQRQVAAPQHETQADGEEADDFKEERSLAGPLNLLAVLEEQRLRREQESLEPQASSPRNSPSSVFSLGRSLSPVPEDKPQEKEDRERSNTESTRASENAQENSQELSTSFVKVQLNKEPTDAETHEFNNQLETMLQDVTEMEEKKSGPGRRQRQDCC